MTYELIKNNKESLLSPLVDAPANELNFFFSRYDVLTKLLNKQGFMESFQEELQNPDSGAGVLLLIDIDQLKRTNIIHGRHVGDCVLKLVADFLRREARDKDIVARLIKDKFALVLTNTTLSNGLFLSNKINKMLNSLKLTSANERVDIRVNIAAVPYLKEDSSKTILSMAGTLLEGRKNRSSIPAYLGNNDAPLGGDLVLQ